MIAFDVMMVITIGMIAVLIWNVKQEGRRHQGRPGVPAPAYSNT
jgi:hypothetical protein